MSRPPDPVFVPVPSGWTAQIDPETSDHGPIDVLFVEVNAEDEDEWVWGVDRQGHLIREEARKTVWSGPYRTVRGT